MSQLTLTPQEDAIVADALRAKAAAYTAMFGSIDAELEALIAKVEGQLPSAVAEEVVHEVVHEVVQDVEDAPKTRKTKKASDE